MKNKGFLSTFYLGYLLCTITSVGVIEYQLQLRIQTIMNIRDLEQSMDQQILILDYIHCQLKQGNSLPSTHQIDGIQFHIEQQEKGFQVKTEGEKPIEIFINVNERQEIINYYVKMERVVE